MQKPMNFENVSTGEFTPVTAGGHHLIIKQVKEQKSRSGKDMLVVAVDMAPNDTQPLYFSKLFEEDTRPEKKWPHAGTIYVVSVDDKGQCTKNFKTFITCFEKSNNVQVNWDAGAAFVNQFAGKKIGGVFGRRTEEALPASLVLRRQPGGGCEGARTATARPGSCPCAGRIHQG